MTRVSCVGVPLAAKTIAVLIDHIDNLMGGYEGLMRRAFEETCKKLDFNLLLVVGRAFQSPDVRTATHNGIFQHVTPASADGVILLSAGLAAHCGADGLLALTTAHASLPRCSVGLRLSGVPSIVVDNRPGMDTLLDHVIAEHGCRRVAYVGGPERNPDAMVRFDAYQRALARHGLPFEPDLVAEGWFNPPTGADAARRILARGARFDALVAANDGMALGAMEVLRARGLSIPEDVIVTGFDDLQLARVANPPLTTVRQPLARMAALAVEIVADQVAGKAVPEAVELPVEFVPRHSCGCEVAGTLRPPVIAAPDSSAAEFVRLERARIAGRLEHHLRRADESATQTSLELVSALEAELAGESGAFARELERILGRLDAYNDRYEEFQGLVSLLRGELRGRADERVEDMWDAARRAIALANTRDQVRVREEVELAYLRLMATAEQFSTSLDTDGLKRAMERELPAMHVENAFVSLYTNAACSELAPFFSIRNGQPETVLPGPFPADRLVPPGVLSDERWHMAFVLPLTFEAERLGVAVFEFRSRVAVFQILRVQISAALKTTALHAEIVQRTALAERSVQERVATAKRMHSLSVLAGGVAHDLNNALGPLVALPDVILREMEECAGADDLSAVRVDIETIKAAALRAAQTIKDLLTLGREGRSSKELLDLNQAVRASVALDPLRSAERDGKRVRLDLALSREALAVEASEPHLVRAISNLIWNATDAIHGAGTIVIRTLAESLIEPLSGYEIIEPGDYSVVTVSDDGAGIPKADILRIFEPFFTKKRLSDRSGSGLGLAIVHGVVKEHGGFLNVESTIGVGTRFSLYFPRRGELVERLRSAQPLPAGRGRVLVVDDEQIQLRTARRVLAHAGFDVTTAQTAAAARELCRASAERKAPFEAVVLDMLLGEASDGLDLFEDIQVLLPSVHGIIASGHAPSARGERALERGLAWLAKPYSADGLVGAVRNALEHASSPESTRRRVG